MIHNPPAFPLNPDNLGNVFWDRQGGMSLRDYFAGVCLSKIIMSVDQDGTIPDGELLARCCYKVADYMLAERAK